MSTRKLSANRAKAISSTKKRRYPGTLKNVLTGRTGDVRALITVYAPALNHRNALPLTGKRPRGNRRSCTAAEDYHVVGLGQRKCFRSRCLHADTEVQPAGPLNNRPI